MAEKESLCEQIGCEIKKVGNLGDVLLQMDLVLPSCALLDAALTSVTRARRELSDLVHNRPLYAHQE